MEERRILSNGMELYSYRNPAQHGFFISLFIKAGCMYERQSECGITHFFEHIAIRNVNKLYGDRLYAELDKLGLEFNASTFTESIQFYTSGAMEHTVRGAEFLSAALGELRLTRADIDSERLRIKAEIRESDDKSSLSSFAQGKVYEGTPLMNSILGKPSTLDKITLRTLSDYRRRILHPDNVFLYVTGNVTDAELEKIAAIFEKTELYPEGEPHGTRAEVPTLFLARRENIHIKPADYTMARFAFDIDIPKISPEATELLYDILLAGYNSRIFIELSEKRGLFYDVQGGVDRYQNIGSFYFSFEVKEQKLEEAIELTLKILSEMKSDAIPKEECARACFVDNAMLLYDDARELNFTFAYDNHILSCGYSSLEDRKSAYSGVTPEEIRAAADEIFKKSNLTLAIKGKQNKIDKEKIATLINKYL